MSHTKIVLIALAGVLLTIAPGMRADALQLKNGDFVQGKYLGGTERAVQFVVNGKIHLYGIDEILSISFASASADGGIPSSTADRKPRPSLAPKSSFIADDSRAAVSSKRTETGPRAPVQTRQIAWEQWEQKLCGRSDNAPARPALRRAALCAGAKHQAQTPSSDATGAAAPFIIPKSIVLTD
jgi:hypothetical protein